ncbi:MAG: InlB B-repeat-containing protein [Clostridia bacterium]|nr:InlB B-repeat-containing protein [Clostridia bacterium]
MKKSLTVCAVFFFLFVLITGCGTVNYRLAFESNGGAACKTVESEDISSITVPKNPTRENYTFDGWYWDNGEWQKPFTVNSILDQPISSYMEMKVYAKWKGISVSVNVEGITPSKRQIEYGAAYAFPLPEGEEGEEFLGWKNADTGEMATDELGNSLKSCDFTAYTTFTPVWREGGATVILDANGGTLSSDKLYVWQDEQIGEMPLPTRTGFSFVGWFTQKEGGERITEQTVVDFESITLYAHWQEKALASAIFDGNGAESGSVSAKSVEAGGIITLPRNAYTKKCHTFVGWRYNGKVYQPYEAVTLEAGEHTFLAEWQAYTYTVVYYAGATDASGSMAEEVFSYGEQKALQKNAFTRKGYAFVHWRTDSGEAYADGEAVKSLTEVKNAKIKLTAVWEEISYSIYFKPSAEAELYESEYVRLTYTQTLQLWGRGFEREGSYLSGWQATGALWQGEIFDVGETVSMLAEENGAVIELVPVWEEVTYTLQYYRKNGGMRGQSFRLKYSEEHTLLQNPYEEEGYSFGGWIVYSSYKGLSEKVFAEGDVISGVTAKDGATVSVWPKWEPITYTVRVYANDGTAEYRDYPATYGEAFRLSTDWLPEREGYTFGCLMREGKSIGTYITDDFGSVQGETVKVYAMWRYNYQGEGTEESPYLVDSVEALQAMAESFFVNATSTYDTAKIHFALSADIDMKGGAFTPIGWYGNMEFSGTVNGNGYTVKNMEIRLPDIMPEGLNYYYCMGFACKLQGEIRDIRFENCSLTVKDDTVSRVGFVAADMYDALICNVAVVDCNITVEGKGITPNSSYVQDISVGGILGMFGAYGHEVLENCYFKGEINAKSQGNLLVGGLASYAGKITACGSDAVITAKAEGNATVGGIAVFCDTVDTAYGAVNATVVAKKTTVYETVNGGYYGTATACYYSDASTFTVNGAAYTPDGMRAVKDESLKNPAWVAENMPLLRTAYWKMDGGYPVLGKGEMKTVEISTKEQLLALSGKSLTEHYLLTASIDLSGEVWQPANLFGVFDGCGNTVTGLTPALTENAMSGLLAKNYGTVKNLVLSGCQAVVAYTGNYSQGVFLGGIAAKNYGKILYCKVVGSLHAYGGDEKVYAGGITAWNEGAVVACYADVEISATSKEVTPAPTGGVIFPHGREYANAAGIAVQGAEEATVIGCYSVGTATASANNTVMVAGISPKAEGSFSLMSLTYNESAYKKAVYASCSGGVAVDTQKINGEQPSGATLEVFFKNAGYLTGTLGMQAFVSKEDLLSNVAAAWVFPVGALPKLYYE